MSRKQGVQQQNRERRAARYESVMEQMRQGKSQREIARNCGLARKTVRRWISARSFQERRPSCHSRPSTNIATIWSSAGYRDAAMRRNFGANYLNKVSTDDPALSATGSGSIAVHKSIGSNQAPLFLHLCELLRDRWRGYY
jgi:hypothetical protein